MSKKKKVTLPSGSFYEMQGKIVNLIKMLESVLEEVPAEHKDEATIEMDVCESYGDYEVEVNMYYHRPETLVETLEREEEEKSHKDIREKAEKDMLKKLLDKYGEDV